MSPEPESAKRESRPGVRLQPSSPRKRSHCRSHEIIKVAALARQKQLSDASPYRRCFQAALAFHSSALSILLASCSTYCASPSTTPSSPSLPNSSARGLDTAAANHDQAVLIEINTPGGLVDSTREIIESIVASPVPCHHLRDSQRQPRRIRRILHPRIGRRCRHGSRHQHRSRSSRHPRRKDGRRHEIETRERRGRPHALRRRQARTQRRTRRERRARVEVLHRSGSLDKNLIEYIATKRARPVPPAQREELQTFQWRDRHAQSSLRTMPSPCATIKMTLKERILSYLMDPNVAFILLAIGAMALYAEFNHPGAVIPWHRRRGLHPARCFRAESAALCVSPPSP
jgi:hypothetical protein